MFKFMLANLFQVSGMSKMSTNYNFLEKRKKKLIRPFSKHILFFALETLNKISNIQTLGNSYLLQLFVILFSSLNLNDHILLHVLQTVRNRVQ